MKRKNMTIYTAGLLLSVGLTAGCTDFEELNKDPNNPTEVSSNMMFAGASKYAVDNVFDPWFSGRQCLVYAQYWAQRNYTEEDRYQIRESTNNNYFGYLYRAIGNLNEVINLNKGESADKNAAYGANDNQIAASMTLRAWLYLVITDTWGGVPFDDVGKLKSEEIYYPRFHSQEYVYGELLRELKEAASMFVTDQPVFTSGDYIYDGDATKWKKFANSLRCRIAIHLSKVRDATNSTSSGWKDIIREAVEDGVFGSNDDQATFKYSATAPYECLFYRGYFVSVRNDFALTRTFMDILKGERDVLNNKQLPWEGTRDPRLSIYTTPRVVDGEDTYVGMPYGIPSGDAVTSFVRDPAPDWMANPPVTIKPDYAVPLMTFAELKFILSEYKDYDADEYEAGVRESIAYWSSISGQQPENVDEYVDAVKTAFNTGDGKYEALALQKYIALYMNGTEAWTEYRRTGYPVQLLQPNEISYVREDDTEVKFEPLEEVKGQIISRVKYPTNESTLNATEYKAAVSLLEDGTNNYYSKMYFDVRTAENKHPANK